MPSPYERPVIDTDYGPMVGLSRMESLVKQNNEFKKMGAGQECPTCHTFSAVFFREDWCIACELRAEAERLIAEVPDA